MFFSITQQQSCCNEHDGRQRAGFKLRAQQVFIVKGPQEEAGSWVQGQAEGHTQGVQKGKTVQAGKRLVMLRSGNRLITGNPIG